MSTYLNGAASLEWVRTSPESWELRDAASVMATFSRGHRAWTASTGAESWTVQRVGFHRPRIVVRPAGALAEIAHLQHDWRGHGTLCTSSGPCFEFEPNAAGLAVRADDGVWVARLEWSGRHDAASARAHLHPREPLGRFGLLILLVAGYVLIHDLGDPSRPRSIGAPPGPTVRSRFA
ncbi:MAG: hypothetical protein Q8P18_25405 [Pseudomonadota bacterium]|nr:hypothetical protein [Pseudomonadota bacterium]